MGLLNVLNCYACICLDQARRRPLRSESNRAAFLCYAQRLSDGLRRTVERSDLLRRGNSHLHNRLFDWIAFLSPAFHPVKHLLHPEAESRQFRSCLGGGVAEDPVAISYYDLVSG